MPRLFQAITTSALIFLTSSFCPGFGSQSYSANSTSDHELEALVAKMSPPSILASDLIPIRDALNQGDFEAANNLCNDLITRPIDSFINAYYGWHMKAAAHSYKNEIILKTTGDDQAAFLELKSAIELGNYPALKYFTMHFLMRDPEVHEPASKLPFDRIARLFRIGLDFGDPFASAAVSLAGLKVPMDPDERLYWALYSIVRDRAKEKTERIRIFQNFISKIGLDKITNIVNKYSRIGGVISESRMGLPTRGLLPTIFFDGDLLGTFGEGAGQKVEKHTSVPTAPTIREQFDFYSRFIPLAGFGNPYLLVAGKTLLKAPNIIVADKELVISEIMPGDRVFVSCGPLSHVAIIYKIDRAKNLFYFIDPTYEFWQPSHNSCVEHFSLVEDVDKRFLSELLISDVSAMLQAVITIRD